MKKLFISLIVVLLVHANAWSQKRCDTLRAPMLSDSAFASVLTCGPGNRLYESFGHSALRICDSASNIDLVFNYGTFDFDEPFFYLKFAKGRLNYCLAVQSFNSFMFEYDYFGRAVWEQRLRLSKSELERLFTIVYVNAQPENRYYKYDFFHDNCATRVRDVIERSLIDRRAENDNYPDEEVSYRDLIYKYTEGTLLWWRLGNDLLLGRNCDGIMTKAQYMYIPMEMMSQYDTLQTSDGNRLAEPAVQILPEKRDPATKSVSPTMCFWMLFTVVLLLTLIARRNEWKLYWLDIILFSVTVAVSLLLIFLWAFSDHWCAKENLNILWANPLFIILLLRIRHYNPVISLVIFCILLCMLIGWSLWPQNFNPAVLPIALTLVLRLLDRYLNKKKYIIS